jgi:hypothetical protein
VISPRRGARRIVAGPSRERIYFGPKNLGKPCLSAKKIAARLGLRFYTVTTYMKHIYRKLGVHNRVSAIVRFHQTNCPQCGCDLKAGTRCTSAGSLADDFDL